MKNKILEVLNKINYPMTHDAILLEYSSKNVMRERTELYNDYVQSLLMLIFDTYVGDDYMDFSQRIDHFGWCWRKNRENFKKEGFDIHSEKLYEKFVVFMSEAYYPLTNKTSDGEKKLIKLWNHLFNFNNVKSRPDVDCFLEHYTLFENAWVK